MGNVPSLGVRIVNETTATIGFWRDELSGEVEDNDIFPGPLEIETADDASDPDNDKWTYGEDPFLVPPKTTVKLVARKEEGEAWPSGEKYVDGPFTMWISDSLTPAERDSHGSGIVYLLGDYTGSPYLTVSIQYDLSDFFVVTTEKVKNNSGLLDLQLNIRMKPIFSEIKLLSVSLPATLHPILDVEGYCPNFLAADLNLWTPGADGKTAAIACTVSLSSDAQCLAVSFSLPIKFSSFSLVLTGRIRGETTDLLKTDTPIVVPASGLVTVRPKLQPASGSHCAPWVARGELIWNLRITGRTPETMDVTVVVGTHMLELYAVSPRLPPYFSRAGIPLEFLQCMVPPRGGGVATFEDYIKHVIEVIRTRCGMIYDTFGGSSQYGQIDTTNRTASFSLRKWLLDTRLHRESGNKLDFTLNCYDLGSAVQVGLMLGILDAAQEKLLRWHYLEPFGYINATSLIGWEGRCNNPFFSAKVEKMYLDPNDKDRYGFRKHVFLSYNKKVLDATCGPRTGEWTIQEYLNNTIDRETSLYGVYKKTWNKTPPTGTESIIRTGSGVNIFGGYSGTTFSEGAKAEIVDFLEVGNVPMGPVTEDEHGVRKRYAKISFDDLTTELKKHKIGKHGIEVYDEGDNLYDTGKPHLAWTIIVVGAVPQYAVSLSIDVCKSRESAVSTWTDYLGMASPVLKDAFVLGKDEVLGPRYVKARVDTGQGFQLWVTGKLCIKLQGGTNTDLYDFALEVQQFLNTAAAAAQQEDPKGKHSFGEGVETGDAYPVSAPSENHYRVNTSFYQTIKFPEASQFKIDYESGCLILLKAETKNLQLENAEFKFYFLARRVGFENITIKFWNGSFSQSKEVSLSFYVTP